MTDGLQQTIDSAPTATPQHAARDGHDAQIEDGAPEATEGSGEDPILDTLTDAGNAVRFAAQWGDTVRYVPESRQWLLWTGARWAIDRRQEVVERAKETAKTILLEAARVTDPEVREKVVKHARASQARGRLRAMLGLASSIPRLVVHAADLDKDPMLLGVQNGLLDLATGELREAKPSNYITRQCPVVFDPNATCPEFIRFLDTATGRDATLIAYIRRILGYCLTGITSEQCFFFLHGSGANGKSTLLNALKDLLGPDYCKQTPAESLMAKAHGRAASNDLARLQGARVTLSSEVEEGSRLSEARVKQLTGSDPVTARFLYREFSEFVPQFKLIIAGNYQPAIHGDDLGIWRRLQLVPFTVSIAEGDRDPALPDKLRAELSGILNVALKGCREWREAGLMPPTPVSAAIAEYKSDMDILGHWVAERCVLGSEHQTLASQAYADFKAWATANVFPTWNANIFGRRMKERYERKKSRDGAHYLGVGLKYAANPL